MADQEEDGKMFIGGLNRETTDEDFKSYFSKYGEVTDCVLMREQTTKVSRGFGFITFRDPSSVAEVIKNRPHVLDHKTIDPKQCTARNVQQQRRQTTNQFSKSHKIFLGGISMDATEDDVKQYFNKYGTVTEVVFVVSKDDPSKPHKGFGFVTFEDESSVNQAIATHFHTIKDKKCEAKKAESKDRMGQGRGPPQGGYNNQMGGYGQGQMGGYGQGQMGNQSWGPPQPQGQGNYGYGQNYPTSYPQASYGNQGYGGYGYGYPQQQMGYGGMANMGGNQQTGVQGNNNNGNQSRPDMGNNYQQAPTNYGPAKQQGGDYNNGANSNYSAGANQMGSGGESYGGGGKTTSNSNSQGGYHPYRR